MQLYDQKKLSIALDAKKQLDAWCYYSDLDSTQNQAKRDLQGYKNKSLLILSDVQTQGRGRLQRSWESPEGQGIYVSLAVQLSPLYPSEHLGLFNIAAALAAKDAMDLVGLEKENLIIKWPNDVYYRDKKLSGILSELYLDSGVRWVIIGMGMNVNWQIPESNLLYQGATSIKMIQKKEQCRIKVLSTWLSFVFDYLNLLEQGEVKQIISCYEQKSNFIGRNILYKNSSETQVVQVIGLDACGHLQVLDGQGKENLIIAGDIELIHS